MIRSKLPEGVGIVLAGVHTWGQSALEQICPRPLLPLAGRPLVWHVLDWLRAGGISRATICANSNTAAFHRCLGDGSPLGMSLKYYHDSMPRGPAGCMRDAALRWGVEDFLVVDGTIITQVDLRDLLGAHKRSGASLTVVVTDRNKENEFGVTALEPVGIYVVSHKAVEHVGESSYQDIKEVWIPQLYERGERVVCYIVRDDAHLRIAGTLSYLAANHWVIQNAVDEHTLGGEYRRMGEAWVHRSAQVSASACLAGPVLIGPRCAIEDAVTVVGPTTIGPGCRIERDAVVGRSVIWYGSHVGAGALVDHCVLTNNSIVDSGVVVRDAVHTPAHAADSTHFDAADLYWRLTHRKPVLSKASCGSPVHGGLLPARRDHPLVTA